jgi:HAD superfamily hydrolase (TIGR01509 family)
VPEVALEFERLRAIIFDLDGTLYRQGSLRRTMALRLLSTHLARPLLGLRTARVLSAYRRAQEQLRTELSEPSDLTAAQLRLACESSGCEAQFVAECVDRWMEREPLRHLAARRRPGLREFLADCRRHGLRLAVLSDYPAQAKLEALGVRDAFDLVLTAQSPEVGLFKPHPRGLLAVAEGVAVTPSECLYIGDREEVDAAAAAAAGIASIIIGPRLGFRELRELAFGQRPDTAQPVLDLA